MNPSQSRGAMLLGGLALIAACSAASSRAVREPQQVPIRPGANEPAMRDSGALLSDASGDGIALGTDASLRPAAVALASLRRSNSETPSAEDTDVEWSPQQQTSVRDARRALERYVQAAVEELSPTAVPGAIEARVDGDLTGAAHRMSSGILAGYNETNVVESEDTTIVELLFAMGCGFHHELFVFDRGPRTRRLVASTVGIDVDSAMDGLDVFDVTPLSASGAARSVLLRFYGTFCASQWHSQRIVVLQSSDAPSGRVALHDAVPSCVGCPISSDPDAPRFARTAEGFWIDVAVETHTRAYPAPIACVRRLRYELRPTPRRVTDYHANPGRCRDGTRR